MSPLIQLCLSTVPVVSNDADYGTGFFQIEPPGAVLDSGILAISNADQIVVAGSLLKNPVHIPTKIYFPESNCGSFPFLRPTT